MNAKTRKVPARWGGLTLRLAVLCLYLRLAAALGVESGALPTTPPSARIFPDYAGVTVPPNIAPLNFRVLEPGSQYRVKLGSVAGEPIEIQSRDGRIQIPGKPWRALLQANTGQEFRVEIDVKEAAGRWRTFAPITNSIAAEAIDGYLVYRLLRPLYNYYSDLGIYQRNLEAYTQTEVLHGRNFENGCLNCHTFLNHQPEPMTLAIRTTDLGRPMLLIDQGKVAKVDKTTGYASWHPSGKLIAFSLNKLSLFFHTIGENRDVFDADSDLAIYRVDSNTVLAPPPIARPGWRETWPAWSPDGRYLYFSCAPPLPFEQFKTIRYDLMRVAYDLQRDQWGEPELVLSAKEVGQSIVQPKPSPDGRFLLFCLCDYGSFPIYQTNSDLALLDLQTKHYRRLDTVNSPQSDSWHCWSSNSRWIVFSSKRLDGLFARPHFSHIDTEGQATKPFLLPQKDPTFYDSFTKTFNVPELISAPIRVKPDALAEAILKPKKVLKPKTIPQAGR